MQIKESYIYFKDVCFYSYHGVIPQEKLIGNNYVINLRLAVDIAKAMKTDNIKDTVNYAEVYQVLADEMGKPSGLLEHVAARIIERLFREFPSIKEIEIRLSKRNPPVGADMEEAGVELRCGR